MYLQQLKILYSPIHLQHNPPYEIYDGKKEPYAERPERIEAAVRELKLNNIGVFCTPKKFPMKHIFEVHHKDYAEFIRRRSAALKSGEVLYPSYYMSDTYAPITAGTFSAAKTAVDLALTGALHIVMGEKLVVCLCRPPGHHAGKKTMGGYCYFNNAAVAANYLSRSGRVAILDIDFHHGNGIQDIFYNRSDVLYVSIHADPAHKYPYSSGYTNETGDGEGKGFNKNYPLALGTNDGQYWVTFQRVLSDIQKFHPKYLVVSVGFDTYEKDPIGGFKLTTPFYQKLGEGIAGLKIPTLLIQEGGYYIPDFGTNMISFLTGF